MESVTEAVNWSNFQLPEATTLAVLDFGLSCMCVLALNLIHTAAIKVVVVQQ